MIKAFISEMAENTYIIKEKNEAIIIDPGANALEIIEFITKEELVVKYILLTHGHFDHIFSLNDLMKKYDCDVYIHELERDFLFDPNLNASSLTYSKIVIGDKHRIKTFKENSVFPLKINDISVIHNPGHTRGSSSFRYKKSVFVGDLIFSDGVGRTDLPTGNQYDLEKSINKLLNKFGDNDIIYPGHGAYTTVLTMKNNCPYYIK